MKPLATETSDALPLLNAALAALAARDIELASELALAAVKQAPELGAAHIIAGHVTMDREAYAQAVQMFVNGLELLEHGMDQAPLSLEFFGPEPVTATEIEGSARVDLGECLMRLARNAAPEESGAFACLAKRELEAALRGHLHPVSREQAERLLEVTTRAIGGDGGSGEREVTR